jgi:hypothetical protein
MVCQKEPSVKAENVKRIILCIIAFGAAAAMGGPKPASPRPLYNYSHELSAGLLEAYPVFMAYGEYDYRFIGLTAGASYCVHEIDGKPAGYDFGLKFYPLPGYVYVKTGYGIIGVEKGGHIGKMNYPLYGAHLDLGGRALIGDGPPYFFFAIEAGLGVRQTRVRQADLIGTPRRFFPEINLQAGVTFLREYF